MSRYRIAVDAGETFTDTTRKPPKPGTSSNENFAPSMEYGVRSDRICAVGNCCRILRAGSRK